MNDQQRASRIALESVRARSQRIRVGMTGLFGILLVVGLASIVTTRVSQSAAVTASTAQPSEVQAAPKEAPVEPLAELGVAPEAAQPAQQPQAQAAPAATAQQPVLPTQ